MKVIMLTAMANIEDKVSAFSAGANDYLVKPIENDELVSRVKMHAEFRCTELALHESQRQFQQIGEISPFPILILSHDGQTEYINPQFTRLFGYTIDDIPTIQDWFERAFPDIEYRNEVMSIWKNDENSIGDDGTEPVKRELYVFCSDKSTKTVTVRTMRMDRDKFYRVFHDITENKKAEQELNQKTHDLTKRVKELDCLYSIAELIETPGISVEGILRGTAELLPIAWQYPELACAQITLDDQEFSSEGFKETPWQQTCNIMLYEEPIGIIKVGYLEERPTCDEGPFVNEERNLLNAISERLGRVIERKNAKKALQESEERFKEMANLLPQSVFELDLTGRLTFVNNHGIVSTGYTLEDFNAGINAIEIFIPEDRERIVVNMSKRLEGIEFPDHEYTALRKDGSTFPVLLYSSPIIRDEKPVGLRGIALDITELKEVEEQLRLDEENYRTIFQNSAVAITVTDKNENIVSWNKFTEDILGMDREDLYMKPVSSLYPEDEWKKIRAQNVRRNGMQHHMETKIIKNNQEIMDVKISISVLKDKNGSVTGSIGIIRDITERKQAEEELRESEEKFRVIASSANDAIIMIDNKGSISLWNNAATTIFGYTQIEALGKELHKLLAPSRFYEDHIKGFRIFHETGTGNAVGKTLELSALRKSGEEFPIELSMSALQLENEWHAVGIIRDITERKRIEAEIPQKNEELRAAEEELREANQHLEGKVQERTAELKQVNDLLRTEISDHKLAEEKIIESNYRLQEALDDLNSSHEQLLQSAKLAAIGELISGISHELKNPLAAISMAAEILDRKIDDEKSKKHIQIVSNHVQRAVSIVDNLLSFARKHEPNRSYVSVNNAIQSTIELLSYELMRDKIEVVTELDSNIPNTMVDFNQMQHVFLNLIGNAGQAMHEAHGKGKLAIRTQKNKETIQIIITDDGPGIPEEIKDRIFEPFFTTKRVGKGTGLGLSICYGIIDQHGGTIQAESKEGEGSTFTVELPIIHETMACTT